MHTYSFFCAWIKHQCIVFNALLPTSYNSLFICTGAQVFPMLDWHAPIYGSPFKCIAFDLWTFPIDSYVQIVSKYGLSCCSFSDIFDIGWFYANECSPQIFLIGWPIMPPWFLGSGHSVDSVLAMCAHPLGNHMHFIPKSIYFFNPALQRIMPICGFHWHSRYSIWISTFILLHCVWFPGSSCGHKLLTLIICHENWFIASRIAWMPNVYCIYW